MGKKNKNNGGNESKKKGKGMNQIPPNAPEKRTIKQLLVELHGETEIMKKWYNKYCQIVPVDVNGSAEDILKENYLRFLHVLDDKYLPNKLTVYETADKESLHNSLEVLLTRPENYVDYEPNDRHKESYLRKKYRSLITNLSNELAKLFPTETNQEISFKTLQCRRQILENQKALVYVTYWTGLYQKIEDSGWKCENDKDIHDLMQVMMFDKFVKFTDEYPKNIYWSESLVGGTEGDDSWKRRHNCSDNTISCSEPLPPLNDTPEASTSKYLNDDCKKVCKDFMTKWKNYLESVDKELKDSERVFKFRRSLLEEEKNIIDREEVMELVMILVVNSRRLNGVGAGAVYKKHKWNRQLALAILQMQQEGLLSWMCLPVYFKKIVDGRRMDEAREAHDAADDLALFRAVVEYVEDDSNYLPPQNDENEQKKRRIFDAIVQKSRELEELEK